jgi:hypothetical protein
MQASSFVQAVHWTCHSIAPAKLGADAAEEDNDLISSAAEAKHAKQQALAMDPTSRMLFHQTQVQLQRLQKAAEIDLTNDSDDEADEQETGGHAFVGA